MSTALFCLFSTNMFGLLALIVSSLMPVCSNTSRRSHSLLQALADTVRLVKDFYVTTNEEEPYGQPMRRRTYVRACCSTSSDNADIVVDVVTSVSVYTNVCLLKLFTLLKCSAAHSSRRVDWSHECYEN
ncbi:hypothetical protein GQX74_003980 [Glossina fuscipes]|nr:hypothetical protein GQX74_003980 [Glossina fuscipes]